MKILILLFAITVSSSMSLRADNSEKNPPPSRAKWLQDAKWGTMTHYLSDWLVSENPPWSGGKKLQPSSRVIEGPMTPKKWNALVNNFDVETFADQLASTGAGYHIMTCGQTSGYYISPNKTYDQLIGRSKKESRFPERDLIKEIGDALHKRGIKFIVYIPIEEPLRGDKEASRKLRPADHIIDGRKISNVEAGRIFIKNWNQVLDEYAQRWGTSVDGWWFDGCWQGKMSYADAPNWQTIIDTLRRGNPNTIVSFNHQYRTLRDLPPPAEDWFAGETNNPQSNISLSSTRDDGAVSQMLTYLGYTWYFGNSPRFDVETAAEITRNITRYGGAITWDIAIQPNGHLLENYIPVLKAINAAAHEDIKEEWQKETAGSLHPEGNFAYKKPSYLLSNKEKGGGHLSQFTPLLPPNRHIQFAKYGVDNDPTTFAKASNEWAWSYAVDLIDQTQFNQIHLAFTKDAFATEYEILSSNDGRNWQTIHPVKDGKGEALTLKLDKSLKARWIKVKALSPNAAHQRGNQMAISELQVYLR